MIYKSIAYGLMFLLISCNNEGDKKTILADEIEISILSEVGGRTININKNGSVLKCYYHVISRIESCQCYRDSLDDRNIDSINFYLDKLRMSKIDSIYDSHCYDCAAFLIKISFKDTTIYSQMIGVNQFNNSVAKLSTLIANIRISEKAKTDSCYTLSTTKFLIPPPPPKNEIPIP